MSPHDYQPINCEFHDVLEAAATRRAVVRIDYRDDDGLLQQVSGRIVDLPSSHRVEYALLDSGQRLRLDRIVAIDGQLLANFPPP